MNNLTNNKTNGVPKYVWIAITTLIGYLIISSFMDRIEEKRLARKYEAMSDQFAKELTQDIHTINKTFEKSMNMFQDVPKIKIPNPIQQTTINPEKKAPVIVTQKPIKTETKTLQKENIKEPQKNPNIKIEMH